MSANKQPAKKSAKPPIISPDQLDKIHQANAANLIKKVKAGKTLTNDERKMLEGMAGTAPEMVSTSRLAQLFGINRKTVAEWRKDGRDVPDKAEGKEPLDDWRAWFAANPDAGYADHKPRKDRETLMCRKLEVEIEIKEIQLDEEKGKLIPIAQARESTRRIVTATRGEFLKLSNDLPPRLAGLNEAKMKGIVTKALHEILERLSTELAKRYEDMPDTE
jgi:DNA-binding transcriptional regulator YiaG